MWMNGKGRSLFAGKRQLARRAEPCEPGGDTISIIERERRAKVICAELNNFVDLKSTLLTVMEHLSDLTGCRAIGVRLRDEGDYPYYVYRGFLRTFIKKENSLCARDAEGTPLLSPDGPHYELECLCGDVIQGRTDASLPFFTPRGSFWTNDTGLLPAAWGEQEERGFSRHTCQAAGYRSLALIPIRARRETIGLIQVQDKRSGCFREDLVEYLEMIGEQIGLAVENALIYNRLKETEERFRSLVEGASDAIISGDGDGTITYWNRAAETIFGYSAKEAMRKNLSLIIPEGYREAHRRGVLRLSARGEPTMRARTMEVVGRKKDGSEFPVELSVASWKGDGGIYFTGILRDITERRQQEEQLAFMATHDPLTGLPNRTLFKDRLNLALSQAARSKSKLAVMLLDLDRFKDVNDTYGHGVGDHVLRHAGDRLRGLLRRSDTVSRLGGDEFLLLLPDIGRVRDATRIAQKIVVAFRSPFAMDDRELTVTSSIGVAIYPHDGKDPDTLIRNADRAMYRAKEQHRDNYQRGTSSSVQSAMPSRGRDGTR